jgi:hypothetical protein
MDGKRNRLPGRYHQQEGHDGADQVEEVSRMFLLFLQMDLQLPDDAAVQGFVTGTVNETGQLKGLKRNGWFFSHDCCAVQFLLTIFQPAWDSIPPGIGFIYMM